MTADDWFRMPPNDPIGSNKVMMYACTAASAIDFALAYSTGEAVFLLGTAAFGFLSYIYWARIN